MGYLNYFIKCVIRNVVYKLSKPKVFLTVLLSVCILFGFKYYGFCTFEDVDLEIIMDGISSITVNQGTIISQLSSMGVDVRDCETQLSNIKNSLDNIKSDTSNIAFQLTTITNSISNLNNTILGIYNTLEEDQQELLAELEENNNSVVSVLEEIRTILQGDEVISSVSINKLSGLTVDSTGKVVVDSTRFIYYFPYDSSLKYNINVVNNNTGGFGFTVYGTNTIPTSGSSATTLYTTVVNANSSYSYQLNSGYNYKYIILRGLQNTVYTIESVEGSVGFDGVQDSINQGNQLQQEQNQLQQEQNDFLRDDNVGVDSSTLPSDTTENITSDGFNSIFQQLYTTFTSSAAQDVVITIPFTNKSFTINANSVYGGANLGFIKTIIEAFWYFVISYFIVQDIGKKINKIKSGDIEHVQETNIKEDIL